MTGFPPSNFFPWGQSVCRWEAVDGFWGSLGFFIWLSLLISHWSLTGMLGYDESHKMQRRQTFFCHLLQRQNSRHPFHLQQPCFLILYADFLPFSSPKAPLHLQPYIHLNMRSAWFIGRSHNRPHITAVIKKQVTMALLLHGWNCITSKTTIFSPLPSVSVCHAVSTYQVRTFFL